VTAVLQSVLHGVFNQPSSALGNVAVSAVAPDIVQTALGGGSNAPLQVNLFLHQVTHNQGWRNMQLPSLGGDGQTLVSSPPLALDLHYLLTAYAAADGQAEALLGQAMLALHQTPALPRAQIRAALSALPSTYGASFASALGNSGLADQVELLTITPSTLGREEMAWLWTAIKADYRPTFPFRVSVVLLQPARAAVSPLPVLERRLMVDAGASPLPQIVSVLPPGGKPTATLGDLVTVSGTKLTAATSVVLIHTKLNTGETVPATPSPDGRSLSFQLPNPTLAPPQPAPSDLPAGLYALSVLAPLPGASAPTPTNTLPLALGPQILASWAPGTVHAGSSVTVTVPCSPWLRPGQSVSLLIGGQQALAQPFTAPTNAPSFTFQPLLPTTTAVPVRLRVEGLDSPILDGTKTPPVFTGPTLEVQP
jgi:hypothetical protein